VPAGGQTGRDFNTRIKEHKKCITTGSTASMVAKHVVESGHNPDFETRVLHIQNKGKKLDALEQIEILQRSNTNFPILNEHDVISKSPLLNVKFC
jgi:hypothetical protein